ncbi:MAG TPA: carboxypeptidase-like regulatory domain-containing protein, partial [Terracidiphilus sp.]|nr:carboxypeptidase-like regulatory domain-containing protein [Terracidiphilus sp.]
MRNRASFRCTVAMLLALFAGVFAGAQQTTSITGQVLDQSGAVVPKAAIVVHNELTNQDVSGVSTSTGHFTITNLRPGLYDVSASAAGFALAAEKGIRLELDASVTVQLTLKPGAATESVVVRADEVQLDLTHPQRGEVFSQDELENAPLDSGNPLLIANVEPGVVFTGSAS